MPREVSIDFMRQLNEAKSLRAQEQGTRCSYCDEPVAEESRQVIPGPEGMPALSCKICRKDFCRKASCGMGVLDCSLCENEEQLLR